MGMKQARNNRRDKQLVCRNQAYIDRQGGTNMLHMLSSSIRSGLFVVLALKTTFLVDAWRYIANKTNDI